MKIDPTFDFRTDTPAGKDPDTFSSTLRSYHKYLWSKRLPSGELFHLSDGEENAYLCHRSDKGEFFLSSDGAVPTFTRKTKVAAIISKVPEQTLENFNRDCYTIGGMILFPSNRIDKMNTINGARGFHPRIQDRFDLTIDCIRLFYMGKPSPLYEVLSRYEKFFHLFQDFKGYVNFFLLQDLVAEDFKSIRFFLPFEGYERAPLPNSVEEYISYMNLATAFVKARGARISADCN